LHQTRNDLAKLREEYNLQETAELTPCCKKPVSWYV